MEESPSSPPGAAARGLGWQAGWRNTRTFIQIVGLPPPITSGGPSNSYLLGPSAKFGKSGEVQLLSITWPPVTGSAWPVS